MKILWADLHRRIDTREAHFRGFLCLTTDPALGLPFARVLAPEGLVRVAGREMENDERALRHWHAVQRPAVPSLNGSQKRKGLVLG